MPENPQSLQQKKDYLKSITIDKNSILNSINTQSGKSSSRATDPFRQAQVTSFNAGPTGLQFDRYYSHPAYNRLGFNPYIDNESNYNTNSTKFEDFKRSTSQWGKLFNIGFSSAFNGKSNVQEALDYENASRIGSTSRGGVFGTLNNAYLNSGYTIGLISEIALEEVALGALTLATGGASSGIAEARTAQNAARLGRAFTNVNSFSKNLFRTAERVSDLKDIGKAKSFYEGLKKGLGVVNPIKGTTDFITASRAGQLDNLGSMAKLTKGFGTFYRDIREINLALGESDLEAGFVINTVSRDLYNDYVKKNGRPPEGNDLDRIQELARDAGKSAYVMNAGLIYATNRVAFDGFFRKFRPRFGSETLVKNNLGKVVSNKNFMKTGQNAFDFVKKGIIPEFKHAFSKTSLKQSPLKALKFLGRYSKMNFSEGTQEWFQEVVQDSEIQRAKDKYYGAVKGGYYDYYSRSMSKFIDGTGLEVFMSGFVMGGMIAPVTYLQGSGAQKINDLGTRIFQPGKYKDQKEYKQQKEQSFQEQIDRLNEMAKNPTKYFNMSSLGSLTDQLDLNNRAEQSSTEGNEKEFRDIEDLAVGKSLLFAIKSGMYDSFIDQLEAMGQMDELDLREAFSDTPEEGVESLGSFRENSSKIIERAKELKNFYDRVNERFQNPFKVEDTSTGDDEDINTDQIKYRAYEAAKDAIILNQYSFFRTLDRMKSITSDLRTNTPFWKESTVNASDISLLLSGEDLTREIVYLREEVKNMVGSTSIERSEIKKKENKLKHLEKFREAYAEFKSMLKNEEISADYVSKKLKSGFDSYMKYLAGTSSNYTDQEKLDRAFQKLIDFYALEEDSSNMSSLINKLVDPKGFSAYVDRQYEIYKYQWENRKEELRSSLKAFQDVAENNELVQQIAKNHGAFIVEEDLTKLVDENIIPDEFYDINTLNLISSDSQRHIDIIEEIREFLIKTGRVPDPTEVKESESEEEIITEVPPTTSLTISDLVSMIDDEGNVSYPEELRAPIMKAYSNFLSKIAQQGIPPTDMRTWMSSEAALRDVTPILDEYNNSKTVQEFKKPIPEELIIGETESYFDPGEISEEITAQDRPTIEIKLDDYTRDKILSGDKATLIRTNNYANSIGLGKTLDNAYFVIRDAEGIEQRFSIVNRGFFTVDEAQGKDFMIRMEGLPTEPNDDYIYPIQSGDITYYAAEEATAKWLSGSGKMVVFGVAYEPKMVELIDDYKIIVEFDKKFIKKINDATNVDEILEIESEMMAESARLIKEYNIVVDTKISDLLRDKLDSINTDLSINNIAVNEVLVLRGKMANFGTVVVNAKGETKKGIKYIRVKSISNPELDEVQINESQAKNMISQKGMNAITQVTLSQEDKSIINENSKNQDTVLDNKEAIKQVIDEARSQSLDEINDEFLDSLGCK